MTRPPIGTRVRITDGWLDIYHRPGVVVAHHTDGIAVVVQVDGKPEHLVVLDPSCYEVLP